VLLIDEYDYPLVGTIREPEKQEANRISLYKFYTGIKAVTVALKFALITGITKLQ
jgi:hypothetical protein